MVTRSVRATGQVATITFTGASDPDAFAEFVFHRASRLNLTVQLRMANSACVRVSVAGEASLIDAFEMACSLGPVSCLVLDVARAA